MSVFVGNLYSIGLRIDSDAGISPDDFLTESCQQTNPSFGKGWTTYNLTSQTPLSQTDQQAAKFQPNRTDFAYRVHVKISHHLLVASIDSSVVEIFMRRTLRSKRIAYRRTQVRVAQLVEDLTERPESLALTHLHGRVGGTTQGIKTMSLWGDDLAQAELWRDNLRKVIAATQCGLKFTGQSTIQSPDSVTGREASPVDEESPRKELLRISNEGQITFFHSSTRLRAVETLLNYLYANSYFVD